MLARRSGLPQSGTQARPRYQSAKPTLKTGSFAWRPPESGESQIMNSEEVLLSLTVMLPKSASPWEAHRAGAHAAAEDQLEDPRGARRTVSPMLVAWHPPSSPVRSTRPMGLAVV